MGNRVNTGDTQTVKDNTGSGTTSNPKQDVVLLGKGDDVPNDKEVVGELGLLYYL
ncbi:hypothetical protein ES703_73934 [subsurface metagenome]